VRIDRTRVDELLRSITEKKIDPDSAARSLLGIDAAESMQSLVERLGPPPAEVEEDWKRQIQSIAKSWQAKENRPLPPLTLADWLVDAENRVSLAPKIAALADHPSSPSPAMQPALELAPTSASIPASTSTANRPRTRKRRRKRSPAITASIAAAALILLLVWANSRQPGQDESPLANEQKRSPARDSRFPSPLDPGFLADPQPAAAETMQLQAGVMSQADTAATSAQPVTAQPPRPDFGFDNPLLSELATTTAATLPADQPADTDWDSIVADRPESDSSEIEDQTVESATPRQAVTLPMLRPASTKAENRNDAPADNVTLIGVNVTQDAQWDFPTPTTIQFAPHKQSENESNGRAASWSWIDTVSSTELATLHQADDQLLFRWSEQATSSPLSRQMAAGRLRLSDTTGQSASVFLRPHLRTSPLRLDAIAAEARFNWPLEGPAIYQAPRLNLQATTPKAVEMSWVEPPDPTNIRKQIATLQWNPSGKSSPAIRCRIECKATTKLQMRLRYFAQLDSTFPWQPYSATQLTLALDQVTQLLERRTAELSQLESQYRNATTSEKRPIRPLKENVEQAVNQFRAILQRLQQLNILHSAVATTSHLQLTFTTDWPDGPQTILEIPLPDQ
jgi:hypothetical protein